MSIVYLQGANPAKTLDIAMLNDLVVFFHEYDLNMSGIRFSGMIFGDPFDDWVWKTEMAIEFTEARLSMLENEWYPSQWQFVKWF